MSGRAAESKLLLMLTPTVTEIVRQGQARFVAKPAAAAQVAPTASFSQLVQGG